MEILVITYSFLAFILAVIIATPLGKRIDRKQSRIDRINNSVPQPVFQELQLSFYERFVGKGIKAISEKLGRFAPKKKKQNKTKTLEAIRKQLRFAGMFMDPADFQFIKQAFLIGTVFVTLVVVIAVDMSPMIMLLVLAIGVLLGVMGPTMYLRSRVSGHQNGIKKQLPDAMDMLCVCIEAGLGFDAALLKVSQKLSGPFIDELMIVYREIQMGRTRREALQNLCDATNLDELKTFASALVQAEQLGIPINNVMRSQSEQLRVERSQAAKEKGMKASIKMLIPMLLFIFPVVFIILMGPTVLNIIETF
ncbi:MAG: type II secretion system F family protein [Clostridia bacterium]|nr:type II secretion system F family protein [Clostridia bacterium]